MTTNESPRAKSSAISAAIRGLAGGVAAGAAENDTVAGRARLVSFAMDPAAAVLVLEAAPAAVLITAALAADTELSDAGAFFGVASLPATGLWARASGRR
jgi:hypothetical protein